jgi:hypothetical protein
VNLPLPMMGDGRVRGEEMVEKQVGRDGSAVCIAKYSTQSTVQDIARRPVQWWFDAILCTALLPVPASGEMGAGKSSPHKLPT